MPSKNSQLFMDSLKSNNLVYALNDGLFCCYVPDELDEYVIKVKNSIPRLQPAKPQQRGGGNQSSGFGAAILKGAISGVVKGAIRSEMSGGSYSGGSGGRASTVYVDTSGFQVGLTQDMWSNVGGAASDSIGKLFAILVFICGWWSASDVL